jgi:hypothetical protein
MPLAKLVRTKAPPLVNGKWFIKGGIIPEIAAKMAWPKRLVAGNDGLEEDWRN